MQNSNKYDNKYKNKYNNNNYIYTYIALVLNACTSILKDIHYETNLYYLNEHRIAPMAKKPRNRQIEWSGMECKCKDVKFRALKPHGLHV